MQHQAIPNTRENYIDSFFIETTFKDLYITDLILKLVNNILCPSQALAEDYI